MPKPEGTYPLLTTIESPADLRRLPAGETARAGGGTARIPDPERQHPRRPLCGGPGHGRADGRPALRVRHAARPAGLGRGPPGLSAQGAHRSARPLHTIKQREAWRRFRPRPRANTTPSAWAIRAPRSARRSAWRSRPPARASDAARGRRHRRWRHDRRHGLRGAEPRRLACPIDLLVVLNDNDMSISENVGALSNYLARVLSGRLYAHLRESGKKVLRPMPTVWELARRSEEHMKGMVLPGTMFEEMGFNYIGPDRRPRSEGAGAARCGTSSS